MLHSSINTRSLLLSIPLVLFISFIISRSDIVKALDFCIGYTTNCYIGVSCPLNCGQGYPRDGSAPTTNPDLISNCSVPVSHRGYGVQSNLLGTLALYPVNQNWGYLVTYCPQGTKITSTASGQIIVYSKARYVRVTAPSGTYPLPEPPVATTGYQTGLNINDNEQFTVEVGLYTDGGDEKYDAKGWVAYTVPITNTGVNDFFTNAINNATANGYTIISKQIWGDSESPYVYDTYDLNDTAILIAIKAPSDPPTCGENQINLTTSAIDDLIGNKIYLSERARFSMVAGNSPLLYKTTDYSNTFYVKDTTSSIGFSTTCNPTYGVNTDCTITNKVTSGTPTIVKWTHNYQNCKNFLCVPCVASTEFNIHPYPGTLKVIRPGDYYTESLIKQVRLSQYSFPLAEYSVSSQSLQSDFIPSISNKLSTNNMLLFSYDDSNSSSDYYSQLSPSVLRNGNLTPFRLDLGTNIQLNNQTTWDTFIKSTTRVVTVQDDLTIGSSAPLNCKSKTVFFVPRNLTIYPPFGIDGDNACMFIVGGTTTIANPILTFYSDSINSFIITNDIVTIKGNKNLNITGGLITKSLSFNRNINIPVVLSTSINKSTSSETIIYEGGRYYKHFKDIISNPIIVNIQEEYI